MARKLDSSYMMGNTNIVCFDKTGTLTKNNLQISLLSFSSSFYSESAWNSQFPGETFCKAISEIFSVTSGIYSLDQETLVSPEDQENLMKQLGGRAVDKSVLKFLFQTKRPFNHSRLQPKIIKSINSSATQNLFNCVVVFEEESKRCTLYFKGNTDYLFGRSNQMICDRGLVEITSEDKINIRAQLNKVKQSMRSVTLAKKIFENVGSQEEALRILNFDEIDTFLLQVSDIVLISILILQDEIRENMVETFSVLRKSGIRAIVSTGDNLEASLGFCIQNQILASDYSHNLIKNLELPSPFVLTGKELRDRIAKLSVNLLEDLPVGQQNIFQEEIQAGNMLANHDEQESPSPLFRQAMKEEDRQAMLETSVIKLPAAHLSPLQNLVQNLTLLANASDKDKAMLVIILRKLGNIVCYVGDGNNDALALKAAHVGISMGVSGTNIAKENSSLILIKDELSKMIPCVEWGRNIVENIQRFIYFQLTVYIVSIYMMIVSSIALAEAPFSILQIIWLTLIQDIFSSIGLALEKPRSDILHRKKTFKKEEKLINMYLVKLIIAESAYQIIVLTLLLFTIPEILKIPNSAGISKTVTEKPFEEKNAVHYTILFNCMVFLQIFNLLNARRLEKHEENVLEGLDKNKFLLFDLIFMAVAQICIVEFGGQVFKCGRLTIFQFLLSTCFGLFNLIVFYVIKKWITSCCDCCCFKKPANEFSFEEEESVLLKKD